MGEGESTEWPDDDTDPFGTSDEEPTPEEEAVETQEVEQEPLQEPLQETLGEQVLEKHMTKNLLSFQNRKGGNFRFEQRHCCANSMIKQ